MKRLLATLAIVVTAMSGAVIVVADSPVEAHPVSTHFTRGKWPNATTIRYGFQTGFPGGEYRQRIADAAYQWTKAANTSAEPRYSKTLADGNWGSFDAACSLSSGNNSAVVFWKDLNYLGTEVLGATNHCLGSGLLYRMVVAIDATNYWYTGTAQPGPAFDLWSAASHEFGHGTGYWVHLSESDESVCPFESGRHTMCPSLSMGSWSMRGLNPHDVDVFQAAY